MLNIDDVIKVVRALEKRNDPDYYLEWHVNADELIDHLIALDHTFDVEFILKNINHEEK